MKNQNDLIISIVAVVLMLIGVGVAMGTARQAVKPAAPEAVIVTPPALPKGSVLSANSLPGGGGSDAPQGGMGRAGAAGGGAPAAGGAAPAAGGGAGVASF